MSARVLQFQCDSGFYSNVHQDSEETLRACTPPYMYLWLGNVLLAAFASAFFISNQLQLRWVVVILPASALLMAVAVVRWGSSCSQRKASTWRNEDLRQSLLRDDDDSDEAMPDNHQTESNALSEFVDAGDLRGSIDSAIEDLRQLPPQLSQVVNADGGDSA